MVDEKIYMIPVNDAFSLDCECAFCHLESEFEKQCIEIVLGESVMEVDARIETNKKGFCKKHYHMLLTQKNKLPYGLMLETHLLYIISQLEKMTSESNNGMNKGFIRSIFGTKNSNTPFTKNLTEFFDNINSQCVICERMNLRMKSYFDVFFFMWKTKKDFQQKVLLSKGFCLYHFNDLLKSAQIHLSLKAYSDFIEKICKIQIDSIIRIYEDVSTFNKQFDYRNANNVLSQQIRNSLINATEKLGKYK